MQNQNIPNPEAQDMKRTFVMFVDDGGDNSEIGKMVFKSDSVTGVLKMFADKAGNLCKDWEKMNVTIEEVDIYE